MPIDLSAIGMMAATAGTQLAVDTASGAVKSKRGYKYSNMLADAQQLRNMEMTDYNMTKQLEMWEKTGYEAQKDQLKRAGLNPALMYGMGGGGGQTSNVNTGNGGIPGLADVSSDAQGLIGMAMQKGMEMQLLKAQKENIEADTANKKQGTQKTWQETHKLQMDNLIQEISQSVKPDGSNAEGDIHESAAVKQMLAEKLMSSKELSEIAEKITLLKEQGETEEQIQKKLANETKLLQNEIDWQALEITGDNAGSVMEKIIKILIGMITGARGIGGKKGSKTTTEGYDTKGNHYYKTTTKE